MQIGNHIVVCTFESSWFFFDDRRRWAYRIQTAIAHVCLFIRRSVCSYVYFTFVNTNQRTNLHDFLYFYMVMINLQYSNKLNARKWIGNWTRSVRYSITNKLQWNANAWNDLFVSFCFDYTLNAVHFLLNWIIEWKRETDNGVIRALN